MNCTWSEEQAYKLADGSLDPATKEEYLAHVAICAPCGGHVAAAERLEGLLRAEMAPVAAPAALAGRIAQAVAAEREARQPRFGWTWGTPRRAFSLALASLLVAVGLFAAAAGPEAVLAVVQKALFFVPGFGISAVDEDTRVNAAPVVLKDGAITLTVDAVLADAKRTTIKYSVTGLPGGKQGWERHSPGQGGRGAEPKRAAVLRDNSGREYPPTFVTAAVGGSAEENHVSAEMSFPALSAGVTSVRLLLPKDDVVPVAVLPGADQETWEVEIPLTHPAERGLAVAKPQLALATVQGVTLQVVAVATEAGRTAVLLESKEWVAGLGANGSDIHAATVLRDSQGRTYKRLSDQMEGGFSGRGYRQTLYFEPLAPDAGELTLTVSELRLNLDARAQVSFSLAGRKLGESWNLDRVVDLGGYPVRLERATLASGQEPGMEAGWLYVEVDLGPTVDGRQLSSFSVDNVGSHMGSMGAAGNRQFDLFGFEVQPGQSEAKFELSHALLNLEGPWQLTISAAR
ncbi:MAG: hypothetical protein ACYC4L_10580 [Chloroflexota bacterium]